MKGRMAVAGKGMVGWQRGRGKGGVEWSSSEGGSTCRLDEVRPPDKKTFYVGTAGIAQDFAASAVAAQLERWHYL